MIWKTLIFLAIAYLAQNFGDDLRQYLRETLTEECKKYGAENKVEDIEAAGRAFFECQKELVDMKQFKNEIETRMNAKSNGALDEVFKNHCAKSRQLNNCINSALDSVAPCMDPNERGNIVLVKNSTNQLIDFVCYKDGVRITLFIDEGGPECLQSKADPINDCFRKFMDSFSNVEDTNSLSTAEKCAKFDELTTCLVSSLEQCSNPIPGNMVDSLMKFVRNGLPCPKN